MSRTKSFKLAVWTALTSSALLLASSGFVWADTITYSSPLAPFRLPEGSADRVVTQSVSLPSFDQSIGQLAGVNISLIVSDIDVLGNIRNPTFAPSPASSITFGQHYSFQFIPTENILIEGDSLTTTTFGSDLINHRFVSSLPLFLGNYQQSQSFNNFVGAGHIDFLFLQNFIGSLDDPSLTQLQIAETEFNLRQGEVTITYSYAAPIPEPETYAMLLAGLGLLGFAARRRKEKEAA